MFSCLPFLHFVIAADAGILAGVSRPCTAQSVSCVFAIGFQHINSRHGVGTSDHTTPELASQAILDISKLEFIFAR